MRWPILCTIGDCDLLGHGAFAGPCVGWDVAVWADVTLCWLGRDLLGPRASRPHSVPFGHLARKELPSTAPHSVPCGFLVTKAVAMNCLYSVMPEARRVVATALQFPKRCMLHSPARGLGQFHTSWRRRFTTILLCPCSSTVRAADS